MKKNYKPTDNYFYRHGLYGTPMYRSWQAAKARCYYKKNNRFNSYGGRGITMDNLWKDDFLHFYNDMKDSWKKGLSLDRINVDGNYCKKNCQWATKKQQMRNMRSNHLISYLNQTKPLVELCEDLNLDYEYIKQRINRLSYSFKEAIEVPKGIRKVDFYKN